MGLVVLNLIDKNRFGKYWFIILVYNTRLYNTVCIYICSQNIYIINIII
jgi:hypothetical protein